MAQSIPEQSIAFPPGGAVVIGASGGIGAALVACLRASGNFTEVTGFSRPGFDVTDEIQIAAHAAAISNLRLVVVASSVLHGDGLAPEKSWRDLDAARLAKAFAVNAIGPALVIKHFAPRLARDGKAVFVALSARVGSISDNRLGGWYGYRASKAALNQMIRTASVELRRTHPQAVCVALHPGTVDTRLTRPFAKTGLDTQPPARAAARLVDVIGRLSPEQSGGFFDHHGSPIEW